MSFKNYLLLSALAGIVLTGCDSVKFPGFTKAEDTSASSTEPTVSDSAGTPEATDTAANGVSENQNLPVTTEPDAGADEPAPASEDSETPLAEDVSEYADITNLLSINAARCASTGEETMTLAEQANADVAALAVTPEAVNGAAVTTALFPGIVKMEPRRISQAGTISSGHCGATRIANNWFITASHCLDQTYDEIRLISTEANIRDPRASVFEANATICHSAYGGRTGGYSNDVALVSVSDAVAQTLTDIPIARIGETDQTLGPVNYPNVRMAGWGLTDFESGMLSNTLLQADLNLVSAGPAAITVSSTDGSGPCVGDSGGPLLVDEADGASRVVGVLSVVEQNSDRKFCAGDYNARYTNLSGYLDWINTTIGVCTEKPELCARR